MSDVYIAAQPAAGKVAGVGSELDQLMKLAGAKAGISAGMAVFGIILKVQSFPKKLQVPGWYIVKCGSLEEAVEELSIGPMHGTL